jgi:hypothetical protein
LRRYDYNRVVPRLIVFFRWYMYRRGNNKKRNKTIFRKQSIIFIIFYDIGSQGGFSYLAITLKRDNCIRSYCILAPFASFDYASLSEYGRNCFVSREWLSDFFTDTLPPLLFVSNSPWCAAFTCDVQCLYEIVFKCIYINFHNMNFFKA